MEKILVIFYTPEMGLVLDGLGPSIRDEMSLGPVKAEMLWSIEECPGHGLWVWEGYPKFFPDEEGGQYEFIGGTWRMPTNVEWAHFRLTNTFELLEDEDVVFNITEEQLMEAAEAKI